MPKPPKQKKPLAPPNPFKVPEPRPLATQPSVSAEALFLSIGNALTKWECLEETLSTLFETLISPDRGSHRAASAYGALTAPQARRNILVAVKDAYFASFPVKAPDKWRPEDEVTSILNTKRNSPRCRSGSCGSCGANALVSYPVVLQQPQMGPQRGGHRSV